MMEHTVPAPAPHAKQYVFVDEYNRHKRLKVMRACDGCRKRKIRCDGALQNGPWPCGACVRLKLKCVPPTLDGEDEGTQLQTGPPGQNQFFFQNTTPTTHIANPPRQTASPAETSYSWSASSRTPLSTAPTSAPSVYDASESRTYSQPHSSSQQSYSHPLEHHYSDDDLPAPTSVPSEAQPYPQIPHSFPRRETELSSSSSGDPEEVDNAVKTLTSQMGDLKVNIDSMSAWIADYRKPSVDPQPTSDLDDADVTLPTSVMTDHSARIPAEMMPHEDRIMDYFGYYFNYIHPYIPVLNKAAFLEQWKTSQNTVSPLVLEAIFACVSRYLEPPVESKRWLALAAKHEEHYKDVPRLSTVQALLILKKAREFNPKRGYFYRSWMAIKYIATMAMDLGLHEHMEQHKAGTPCKLPRADCLMHNRIWQTIAGLELIIGGPQGRSDFLCDYETIDMTFPFPSAELDAFEYQTARRYAIMAQCVKNVKMTNNLMQAGKRAKNPVWALSPDFQRHNEDYLEWPKALPQDMQIQYPEDGSPPWLGGDHFVANVHAYHHLAVIMHHRPQLQTLLEKHKPEFKNSLDICTEAAVMVCKLQEALLRDFGLHGLLFMLRGINFTVYCVLTCVMLHLVAITCPDTVLNLQARNFFTRHMRVLEQCMSCAGPEVQAQINTLRQAFSKDSTKPFELKESLGMRSPTMIHDGLRDGSQTLVGQQPQSSAAQDWAQVASAMPITSVGTTSGFQQQVFGAQSVQTSMSAPAPMAGYASSFETSRPTSYPTQPLGQATAGGYDQQYPLERVASNEQQAAPAPAPVWDPSGIFNQWNNAFGNPPPPTHPSPPGARYPQPTSTAALLPTPVSQISPLSDPTGMTGNFFQHAMGGATQLPQQQVPADHVYPTYPAVQTVTPDMWQDAFTSAYVSGHGQKRYRDDTVDSSGGFVAYGQKRRG